MTDKDKAEALWAKLCTDCVHFDEPEKCDCLDDILAAFAEIRAAQEVILREHETMRRVLETIAAGAADGLQRTQAIGALANIGPHS